MKQPNAQARRLKQRRLDMFAAAALSALMQAAHSSMGLREPSATCRLAYIWAEEMEAVRQDRINEGVPHDD